jgi:hypothetical protein
MILLKTIKTLVFRKSSIRRILTAIASGEWVGQRCIQEIDSFENVFFLIFIL